MKEYYIGAIFARGGSKGIPNKNIKLFSGKPLLEWSIRSAQMIPRISRIVVSTDSQEIAKVALKNGAEVPFIRPTEISLDDSPEWKAWQHLAEFIKNSEGELPNAIVSIPTTSPLRSTDDIEKCLDLFESSKCDSVITVTESSRNPYFNMVEIDESENAKLSGSKGEMVYNRQHAPKVFDMTTVCYVVSTDLILSGQTIFDGVVKVVEVPKIRAIDIDDDIDFYIAEKLLDKEEH